jgi:hypothetical protein
LDRRSASESWDEAKKKRQAEQLAQKEVEFLRLKRVKLGAEDFQTVQVIGKGAFGEVRDPNISPNLKFFLSLRYLS